MQESAQNYILYFSLFLIVLLIAKVIMFVWLSSLHHSGHKKRTKVHHTVIGDDPLVSLLIPCYNEEITLSNCVLSLLKQSYKNLEIVLINDGSKDGTHDLIHHLADKYKNVSAYSKKNGGKASALNYGIKRAKGSIVVCMDADSVFMKNTVEQLVLSFDKPDIAAVGGNVRVANRSKAMGLHQAVEYISGLTIQRQAFAHIGCMQVISGAIGAFRKDRLLEIGGYSTDTVVEDMDITIELSKQGYRVVYNPEAIAYTEAPEGVADFMKQRYRWTYGGFQIVKKHRDMLFRRKYGSMGLIGLPYFMIFPWVDVVVSFLLFASVIRVVFTGSGWSLLFFYLIMCFIQGSLLMYALIMDKEDKKLVVLAAIDSLFYSHLISFTTLKAGIHFIGNKSVGWNKLERTGKNIIPKHATK